MSKGLDKSVKIAPTLFLSFRLLFDFQSYLVMHAVYYGSCENQLNIWRVYL